MPVQEPAEVDPATAEVLVKYLQLREQERHDQFEEMVKAFASPDQMLMVREAAVLGYCMGSLAAGGIERESYPKDTQVFKTVLLAACAHPGLYRKLAALAGIEGDEA